MRIERVVANASPLIVLFKGDLAGLLPQLFAEIIVPESVWHEVTAAGAADAAASGLPSVTWARRVEVMTSDPRVTAWNLGAGESDVLNLTLTLPGYGAMIDDAAARSCARTLGISYLGTGGALVIAKRRKLICSLTLTLERLRDAGLYLSDDVVRLLKQQAGE